MSTAFQLNAFENDAFQGTPAAITGTGAIAFAHPALSGTALETFSGTGAVAIGHPVLAATGTEKFTATGAVIFAHPAIAANGSEKFSATGAITFARPALVASGAETFTGTGALAIAHPTLAASGSERFTGTGGVIFVKPSLAGTGNVAAAGAVTGTAAVAIDHPALTGSGAVTVVVVETTHSGALAPWVKRYPPGMMKMVGYAYGPNGRLYPERVRQRKQVLISGTGDVSFTGPALTGTGDYDDDELVFELLLAA